MDPGYTPDAAAALITQGTPSGSNRYQAAFPYVGTPYDGYDTGAAQPA